MKDTMTSIKIEKLRTLIKRHDEALAISNALDEEWGNNPCDETLEKKWDEAYKKEIEIHEKIIEVLMDVTDTDENTARKMYDYYKDVIEDVIDRCIG